MPDMDELNEEYLARQREQYHGVRFADGYAELSRERKEKPVSSPTFDHCKTPREQQAFLAGEQQQLWRVTAIINDVARDNPLARGTAEVLLRKLGTWSGWTPDV